MSDTSTERPPFQIDTEYCVGHGRCFGLAPEAFEADEMGKGVVRDHLTGPLTRSPESIANACPEQAIELTSTAQGAGA